MINYFPRLFIPVEKWHVKVISWIVANFRPGDEIQLIPPSQWYRETLILRPTMLGRAKQGTNCVIGQKGTVFVWADDMKGGRNRVKNIGLIDFYCHVKKLSSSIMAGIDWGDVEVTAVQWALAGIDGVANKARMAKAIADNGAIVPDLETEAGIRLKSLIDESNGMVDVADDKIGRSVLILIESELLQLGTSFDYIPRRKGELAPFMSDVAHPQGDR